MSREGGVDDGIGVKVEDALLETFQVAVYFESGVTGGEGSDEDFGPSVVGLIVLEIGVDDFNHVVVDDSDLTYVIEGIGDDGKEMVSLVNSSGGGPEEIFAKLSPEAVEHEFGSVFMSGIFLDETGIEVDAFFFLVSSDVLGFVLRRGRPGRVASGLLLDLEPRVDINPRKVPSYVALAGSDALRGS